MVRLAEGHTAFHTSAESCMLSCKVARFTVLDNYKDWVRAEAEARVGEVLDGAKGGNVQRIYDTDGVFEVRFKYVGSKRAGDYLAQGGPGIE